MTSRHGVGLVGSEAAATTTLAGKGWAYTVPFEVKNKADIEKLIGCESQ